VHFDNRRSASAILYRAADGQRCDTSHRTGQPTSPKNSGRICLMFMMLTLLTRPLIDLRSASHVIRWYSCTWSSTLQLQDFLWAASLPGEGTESDPVWACESIQTQRSAAFCSNHYALTTTSALAGRTRNMRICCDAGAGFTHTGHALQGSAPCPPCRRRPASSAPA
jgi:hypothetical protein